MSRWRKDMITKGICWAVLLVVAFSFIFSGPVLSLRLHPVSVAGLFGEDVAKYISSEEHAELEETGRLRKGPLSFFVQRMLPTIAIRISVSSRSGGIIPANHAPINCPLLI